MVYEKRIAGPASPAMAHGLRPVPVCRRQESARLAQSGTGREQKGLCPVASRVAARLAQSGTRTEGSAAAQTCGTRTEGSAASAERDEDSTGVHVCGCPAGRGQNPDVWDEDSAGGCGGLAQRDAPAGRAGRGQKGRRASRKSMRFESTSMWWSRVST